jgi:hypothetical protein
MVELLTQGMEINTRLIADDQMELQQKLQLQLDEMKKQLQQYLPDLKEARMRSLHRKGYRPAVAEGHDASTLSFFNDLLA